MGDAGPLIVIKGDGNSVQLIYDSTRFKKDGGDPRRNRNEGMILARVVIENEDGAVVYDSGRTHPSDGLKYSIMVAMNWS